MRLDQLAGLLQRAAVQGAGKALSETGALPEYLSKTEAYRRYGRSNVDRWIAEGLIRVAGSRGGNAKKMIDRRRLEAVAAASNRATYLPVADR